MSFYHYACVDFSCTGFVSDTEGIGADGFGLAVHTSGGLGTSRRETCEHCGGRFTSEGGGYLKGWHLHAFAVFFAESLSFIGACCCCCCC